MNQKQGHIFKNLINYKFKYYILNLLSRKYFVYDRNINIFLAFATSSSVATWVFWDKFPFLWAGIIIITQIVNLTKPYFPFSKYCKEINDRQRLLQGIIIEFENLWSMIQNDEVSEKISRYEYQKIRKKIQQILNFPDDIVFNVDKKTAAKAIEKTNSYLARNYLGAYE